VLFFSKKGFDLDDVGGIGGTLAGNALSTAAMRAVLAHVLTDDAFVEMERVASVFARGVQASITANELAWSISQLGARCEYRFANPPPTNGGAAARAGDEVLDEYLHLFCVNRGVLMTPFHNMALMCPDTTEADVALHQSVFDAALEELLR
jgi:glutamate-1-semialdehyde 2,1-aminomutase